MACVYIIIHEVYSLVLHVMTHKVQCSHEHAQTHQCTEVSYTASRYLVSVTHPGVPIRKTVAVRVSEQDEKK